MGEYKVEVIYKDTGTTEKPKGQQIGVPVSDIRVIHIATGIMAQCGVHRSQHKNKEIAIEMIEWAIALNAGE